MEENDRNEGFKVSDKRRFTSEGESRADDLGRDEAPEPEVTGEPQEASGQEPDPEPAKPAKPEKETQERAEHREMPPINFSGFVIGLANSALYQLGLIPTSEEGAPQKDIQGARQTIDIIAMLEEKTRGNLTEEEQTIIKETLFQLRMAFVEASK